MIVGQAGNDMTLMPDLIGHLININSPQQVRSAAESFFFIGLDSSVNLSPKSDRGVLKTHHFAGYLPHLGNFKGVFRPRCINFTSAAPEGIAILFARQVPFEVASKCKK